MHDDEIGEQPPRTITLCWNSIRASRDTTESGPLMGSISHLSHWCVKVKLGTFDFFVWNLNLLFRLERTITSCELMILKKAIKHQTGTRKNYYMKSSVKTERKSNSKSFREKSCIWALSHTMSEPRS